MGAAYARALCVVSASGRDARASPGPVWSVAVLYCTGAVAHGTRARGNVAASGATCPRPHALSSPTMPWGRRGCGLVRCLRPTRTRRKASHATPPDQRRAPAFRIGHDLGVGCGVGAALTLWYGVPEIKPCHASTRAWRWHTSCRIPLSTRLRGVTQPWPISFVAMYWLDTSMQRPPSRSLTEQGFPYWVAMEQACVGGRWPCRARARRG